jgi:ribose 5-phosphate isomerase
MNNDDLKQLSAKTVLPMIPSDGFIGIGTGSTVTRLIDLMADTPQKYSKNFFVPTSTDTEHKLSHYGFNVARKVTGHMLMDIDGADEIDPCGNLIKGGGGALTREKIVAKNSEYVCIIADISKKVDKLGMFKVPVEIIPFLYEKTVENIESLGSRVYTRQKERMTSDNGNWLCDADFGFIENPGLLETQIKMIPGVVEVGIFCNMTDKVIFAADSGVEEKIFPKRKK